jgi:hypothetical protein
VFALVALERRRLDASRRQGSGHIIALAVYIDQHGDVTRVGARSDSFLYKSCKQLEFLCWAPKDLQLGRFTNGQRLRLIACRAQSDVLVEVVERLPLDYGPCRRPDVPGVPPVRGEYARAPTNIDPERPQRETTRVDRLLAIPDGHESAMPGARVETEEQPNSHLGDVLCFVDDHARIPLAVSLRDCFECADSQRRIVHTFRPRDLM